MSVLKFNKVENICIISHQKYLNEIYQKDIIWENLNVFDIKTPYRMDLEAENLAKRLENGEIRPQKKRKRKVPFENSFEAEITHMKGKFYSFLSMKKEFFPGEPSLEEIRHNNLTLRENVKSLLVTLNAKDVNSPTSCHNLSNHCILQDGVILPPKSEFRKLNVESLDQLVGEKSYDLILMDPPWSNKHIKRVKRKSMGYEMMDNDDLGKMPIDKLFNDDGLLFVWCTNKMKHRSAVSSWFSSWGVTMVATWYWVKVTQYGEMVTEVTQDKQPYEVVIIGQRTAGHSVLKDLQDGLVIYSVPSGIHSHKPPLTELIKTVLGEQVERSWDMLDKLEIFGRYLLPGWVTVGQQPCLLNSTIKSS